MKRFFLGLLALLVLLAAGVVFRAATLTSKQLDVPPAPDYEVDVNRVAQRLGLAIRLRTISHQQKDRVDTQAFREFASLLGTFYRRTHRRLTLERVNDYSLLYTWKGRNPELRPVLLAAHHDVVPVDPASRDDWLQPPFGGMVVDGYVWGRGAIDDKNSVICILEAVETLAREGFQPERTVYLAFGHDEELGGDTGALAMAKLLEQRSVELEWVLDEGGVVADGMIPGVESPVAVVGIAEKGHVTIGLSLDAPGGHSSTPPNHTAIGDLAKAIVALEANQMPGHIDGVTGIFLDTLAPELPFAARLVLANRWLFGPLLRWGFTQLPPLAAMTRTTTAATLIDAGVKSNVLPVRATAAVNFRIHPRDRVEDVADHVRRVIDDDRIQLEVGLRTPPRAPSAVSPVSSDAFQVIQRNIRALFPDAAVVPYLVLGGTDARHYHRVSENVYRFGPYRAGAEMLRLAHGTNERISLENLDSSVRFYRQLLLDATGPAQSSSE